jgi:hypothetical protein
MNDRVLTPAEFDRASLPESFAIAAKAFSDHTYELRRRTHRAGAVLRLMQHYFTTQNSDDPMLCEDDTAAMVDLLIETLPHHDGDVNDPLDAFDSTARRTLRNSVRRESIMSEIIDAITIAARGDSTLEEIQEAAITVYRIAKDDPAYGPDFQRIIDIIQSRGFTVSIKSASGIELGPCVDSAETARASPARTPPGAIPAGFLLPPLNGFTL